MTGPITADRRTLELLCVGGNVMMAMVQIADGVRDKNNNFDVLHYRFRSNLLTSPSGPAPCRVDSAASDRRHDADGAEHTVHRTAD